MQSLRLVATQGILDALHVSRAYKLLEPLTRGVGAILMLHRVTPEARPAFDPNGILSITPDFLERAIQLVRRLGYDAVTLDEVARRLAERDFRRPFVSFTLDDGYRDNIVHARPVFARHGVPFTVYVPSSYPGGSADLWWFKLEAALRRLASVSVEIDGQLVRLELATDAERSSAFKRIYPWLRQIDEDRARHVVDDLCHQAGIDASDLARSLIMDWDELRQLARDPLCTIGAHTAGHYALARLDAARCRAEIGEGARVLTDRLGTRPRHFSFPYGSRCAAGPREFAAAAEAGFATAVTTRKGVLHAEHAAHLTALPRLSLNGDFQSEGQLAVLLSGAPFAMLNRFQRLDVA